MPFSWENFHFYTITWASSSTFLFMLICFKFLLNFDMASTSLYLSFTVSYRYHHGNVYPFLLLGDGCTYHIPCSWTTSTYLLLDWRKPLPVFQCLMAHSPYSPHYLIFFRSNHSVFQLSYINQCPRKFLKIGLCLESYSSRLIITTGTDPDMKAWLAFTFIENNVNNFLISIFQISKILYAISM